MTTSSPRLRLSCVFLLGLVLPATTVGCGDDEGGTASPDAGAVVDSGEKPDAGSTPDMGEAPDMGEMPDMGSAPDAFPNVSCATLSAANCVQFRSTERDMLLDTVNDLSNDTTIVIGTGTVSFDNALIFRMAERITLVGQGIDETILDFDAAAAQTNGVDVVGDDFTIQDLTINNAPKDGLRIEDSSRVVIRRIKVTWSGGPSSDNGSYGIYPVKSTDVLIEDCEAYNSADAGIYVGQTIRTIVRRNIARQNVAGIEIENTQFADVYENVAEDNTAGLVVFDLPGNPIVGRDVRIRNNVIRGNNRMNFAPTDGVNQVTTVSQIPAGTGTFALASRRLEITGNTYENNNTVDIALLSGLIIQSDLTRWATPYPMLVGNVAGVEAPISGPALLNFQTNEVWVHDNSFMGSGTNPDIQNPMGRPLGALLGALYPAMGSTPVDSILYDGIGETVMPGQSSTNANRLCFGSNQGGSVGVFNLPVVQEKLTRALLGQGPLPTLEDTFRPAAPFAPFDCSGFTTGPIPVVLLDGISDGTGAFPRNSCEGRTGCMSFTEGQENMLLDTLNDLDNDTTVILGTGTFNFDNAVILRQADGISILGQGMDETTLKFPTTAMTQFNGVDVVGDRFTIQDLTILDAPKDALRVEDSDDVVIRRVRTTWTNEASSDNGSYGIYPVSSTNVLIENCEALNSADAGIYVGQSRGAIIRNNLAEKNVAGLEVENTQFVEVYGNLVTDNTAGLVIFDLPGNPVVGRDVFVHHNVVAENNRANFAPTDGVNSVTTVSQIPAGTGTFALASRRVRISDNFYFQNDSGGVSLLSGLVIQSDPTRWAIPNDMVVGDITGLNLESVPGAVLNFRSKEVLVENNDFYENGNAPDGAAPMQRPIGAVLALTYQVGGMGLAVDDILYDGIEETVEAGTEVGANTNNNRICLSGNAGADYATLDLPALEVLATRALAGQGPPPTPENLYRPAAPFAPFDCTVLTGSPVGPVTLPISTN